jgi:hypothetical protein
VLLEEAGSQRKRTTLREVLRKAEDSGRAVPAKMAKPDP